MLSCFVIAVLKTKNRRQTMSSILLHHDNLIGQTCSRKMWAGLFYISSGQFRPVCDAEGCDAYSVDLVSLGTANTL